MGCIRFFLMALAALLLFFGIFAVVWLIVTQMAQNG